MSEEEKNKIAIELAKKGIDLEELQEISENLSKILKPVIDLSIKNRKIIDKYYKWWDEKEIEAIDTLKNFCTDDCCSEYRVVTPILNLLEKQQTRIDELEKALVEEDLKHRNKIKELEADLYSANCTINDYIEERNKILKIIKGEEEWK